MNLNRESGRFPSQTAQIFYRSSGKSYPASAFQDRLEFIGDVNKKDASIQLLDAQFSDNGTYFCDVKNPPDISGTPARTELRVVAKGEPEGLPYPIFVYFRIFLVIKSTLFM